MKVSVVGGIARVVWVYGALFVVGSACTTTPAPRKTERPEAHPAFLPCRAAREQNPQVARKSCKKPWTALVFMAADNDLYPYAKLDLEEMRRGSAKFPSSGGSSDELDVVVQLDGPGQTGLLRLQVVADAEPRVIETANEKSQVDPAEDLVSFLHFGVNQFPAEHYLVIVWGHGQGYTATPAAAPNHTSRYLRSKDLELALPKDSEVHRPTDNPFAGRNFRGGIAFDYTQGSFLDIPSLSKALSRVVQGSLAGVPIDVYAADACLMQMVEVATEISSSARYLVGSTQVQDYVGLPYGEIFGRINARTFGGAQRRIGDTAPAYLVADLIPEVYQEAIVRGQMGDMAFPEAARRTVTMSTLAAGDLREGLVPALSHLGYALADYLKADPLHRGEVGFIVERTPGFLGGAQDLGVFLSALRRMVQLEAKDLGAPTRAGTFLLRATDAAREALNRTVLRSAYGTDYLAAEQQLHLLGFRALSIWLPGSSQDYQGRIGDFSKSIFYREAPGWRAFLETLYPRTPN